MTKQIITTENAFWQECAPTAAEADTELMISGGNGSDRARFRRLF